ncbi:hypothetical protein B0J12DRAFT_254697 [Macrophomina phaseolina]|uniref:Uncharacterized protein n=1 Tax=Macrophomina phaseolina TaxID=35725 RepID=A0ABQ8G001_9PEZI|nr:hypothetical protein B0J12DRAFT_254697 [Macrophomina phaseolina]
MTPAARPGSSASCEPDTYQCRHRMTKEPTKAAMICTYFQHGNAQHRSRINPGSPNILLASLNPSSAVQTASAITKYEHVSTPSADPRFTYPSPRLRSTVGKHKPKNPGAVNKRLSSTIEKAAHPTSPFLARAPFTRDCRQPLQRLSPSPHLPPLFPRAGYTHVLDCHAAERGTCPPISHSRINPRSVSPVPVQWQAFAPGVTCVRKISLTALTWLIACSATARG